MTGVADLPVHRRSRWESTAFIVLSIVTAIGLLAVVLRQFGYGLEYDEAYLLSVVRNLAEGRGYIDDGVSFETSGEPFEPRISTGPTIIAPAAVVWNLTGGWIAAVRLVPLAYFGLLLASTGWLFFKAGGRWTALAALAGFLALPVVHPDLQNTSLMPGRFVGELTATAFLVAAAAALASRRPFVAGLLGGLAVTTKLVFLLPVLCLLLVFAAWSWFRARRDSWPVPVWFLVGLALPPAAFELVKLVSLGMDGYLRHREQVRLFIADQAIASTVVDALRSRKLLELSFQVSLVSVAVVALLIVSLVLLLRHRGAVARAGFTEPPWIAIAGLAVGSFAVLGWWFLVTAQPSGRVSLPFVMLLTVIAFGLLAFTTTRLRAAVPDSLTTRLLSVAAWLVVASITLVHTAEWITNSSGAELRASQEEAARFLVSDVGYVPADRYWTYPELLLLSGLPSQRFDLARDPVFVFTSLQSRVEANFSDAHAYVDKCESILFDSRDTIICLVPRSWTSPLK